MRPKFVYCYDALCGWCYGFSEVITKLYAQYHREYDFEVLSGGMVPEEYPSHMQEMAPYIQEEYQNVEARTGVKFGQEFIDHIFNMQDSSWRPTSLAPAIAMVAVKEMQPGQQIPAIKLIQRLVFHAAADVYSAESYHELTEKLALDYTTFKAHFENPASREKAHYEFALVKQLRVTGFPTLLLQTDDRYLYLLSRGYSDYNTVSRVLESVRSEIARNN